MTTITNNPGDGESAGSSASIMIVGIVLLVLVALFFVYGLPAIRAGGATSPPSGTVDVNVKLPTGVTPPAPAPTPAPTQPTY